MPFYDFKCPTCGKKEEVYCHSYTRIGSLHPFCCGEKMGRDFASEQGAGFVGRGYPFIDDGIDGTPMEVRDYAHHKRLLRERGMDWHEPKAETKYRRRHIKEVMKSERGGKR